MNELNWRNLAFLFTIFGCFQFVLLSSLAMFIYGGGTRINPNSSGYIFFLNFFSDLGRIQSFGNPNTASAILFFITLLLASIAFATYFIAIPGVINTEKPKKINTLSALGILNSALFSCVALTPADLFPILHDLIVFLAFIVSFLVSSLMYYLFKEIKAIPKFYHLVFLAFSCIIVMYGAVSLVTSFFPEIYVSTALLLRVVMQKIVIYYLITCFFIQSLGALKNYPPIKQIIQ
ncbi:MAG: hypothetical protein ACFFDT_12990 [Candidatus Hodarchaeota archaeon]